MICNSCFCAVPETARLDGFTISDAVGHAIDVLNASPTMSNLIIQNNSGSGAALQVSGPTSLPLIEYSNFLDNTSLGTGGAVYSAFGSRARFFFCRFESNTAGGDGGAVYNDLDANPTFLVCQFVNNVSTVGLGGALFHNPTFTQGLRLEIRGCTINGYTTGGTPVPPVSEDANANGVPDECDPDCNNSNVPDDLDVDPADPDGNG